MKKPEVNRVDVDMVPLIDIISLLLMFLIIVGDSAAKANGITMKLPPADASMKLSNDNSKNLWVIQIDKNADGKYVAVFDERRFDLDGELRSYLESKLQKSELKGDAHKTDLRLWDDGSGRMDYVWDIPVKVRIPEDCPMGDAGKMIMTLQDLKLLKVKYAAAPVKK